MDNALQWTSMDTLTLLASSSYYYPLIDRFTIVSTTYHYD